MHHPFPTRRRFFLHLILIIAATFIAPHPAFAQTDEKAKKGPTLRIVCVSCLTEDQELVLASRDEKGNWHEYGTVKLRSSFLTEWLPAATGGLHLAVRGPDGLVSKCAFTYPEGAPRAIVVLLPDTAKQIYRADVIDPAKLAFAKGSTLLVNYSSMIGVVMLGKNRGEAKSGQRQIMKPAPGPDGMFRMLVAYQGEDGKLVPCYDRYVPNNPEARDFLLLFPDPTMGLRVYSLSEFGPFD